MPLPRLLAIEPLRRAVSASVAVPGSKSITNRALIAAALGTGTTRLRDALWSDDTEVMVRALQKLGYAVASAPEPGDPDNRCLTIEGRGRHVPPGGSEKAPLELEVGNAGTAARFLTALLCLGQGSYRLVGTPRMHERPQRSLLDALRQLGYRIEAPGDRLPLVIHGAGPRPGRCTVGIDESSQFASALLLSAPTGGWQVEVLGFNAEESPYVAMTVALQRAFPLHGGEFRVEPDASSGSYFWAAAEIQRRRFGPGAALEVPHWPVSGWQIDAGFPRFLPLPPRLSRTTDLGDSIMTAIVLAPGAGQTIRFTDLGRLRLQECERVQALRTELTRCGAQVEETGDTLTLHPSELHGATIETYRDHRMAMCFAILGLHVPGLKIQDPACVKKTFPTFFQKLASPPPHGLGAVLRDADRPDAPPLRLEELLAD
jgi:3-phosphoshikimate 1-carboxyvinyltransferase